MKLINTKTGRFKIIAFLEGVSFLVLLCIAMPLKYIWHEPWLVQQMGMAHGIFFVLYIVSIIQNKIEFAWDTKKTLLAMLLSVVPFGTFYVTAKMIPSIAREADGGARRQ